MRKEKDPLKIALNYLSYSDRFTKEIIQRLKREEFSKEEVNSTIEKLKTLGLVDDSKVAREYINAKVRKGWGPERIRFELTKRGVPEEIIESSLKEIFSEVDEREMIIKAMEKFLKTRKGKNIFARAKRFLFRKGFSHDKILDIIEEMESKEIDSE
ncbi:MAG: regulatory protein RecX [Candidatus Aminicenantia bacterium]